MNSDIDSNKMIIKFDKYLIFYYFYLSFAELNNLNNNIVFYKYHFALSVFLIKYYYLFF